VVYIEVFRVPKFDELNRKVFQENIFITLSKYELDFQKIFTVYMSENLAQKLIVRVLFWKKKTSKDAIMEGNCHSKQKNDLLRIPEVFERRRNFPSNHLH